MSIDVGNEALKFHDIRRHIGHRIVAVRYGDYVNVAIECETCSEVLLDADNPKYEAKP